MKRRLNDCEGINIFMNITEKLLSLQDREYAAFHAKLVPTIDKESIIGIRVPKMRQLAKELKNDPDVPEFLKELPHKYYDENLLHALIISEEKDIDRCFELLDKFLPYVDNWAVCDTMNPKVFKKHKAELMDKILQWVKSDDIYTCRFAIDMLMGHFLDEDFKAEYLEIPAEVTLDDYYIRMVVAWFYATALTKQWDSTISYIENKRLEPWTHNKSIQKSCESFRISTEQKEYLRTLKIKK